MLERKRAVADYRREYQMREAQIEANRQAERRRRAQVEEVSAQRAMERQRAAKHEGDRKARQNAFLQEVRTQAQRPLPGLSLDMSRSRQKSGQGDTFAYGGGSGAGTAAGSLLDGLWKIVAGIAAVLAGFAAMGWVARHYQTPWWLPLAALVLATWVSFRVLYNPLVSGLVTLLVKVALFAFAALVVIAVVAHLMHR